MENAFLTRVDAWLTRLLRERVLADMVGGEPRRIGAAEFAAMLTDYLLTRIAHEPAAHAHGCDLDAVSDAEILAATGFSMDVLAAGFIGAAVELDRWTGSRSLRFLIRYDVPGEDAWAFSCAAGVLCEKLGRRGQRLVAELGRKPHELAHAS